MEHELLSFSNSFFRSQLSLDFPSKADFELQIPKSLKFPNVFSRYAMKRTMLQEMSVTYASIFQNISSNSSCTFLFLYSSTMVRVMRLLPYAIFFILQLPLNTPKKTSLIPISYINYYGHSIGIVNHNKSYKFLQSIIM